MDNLTHPVHVVETDQALSGKSSRERHRNTLIVVALDDLQEIDTENFEYHHKVLAIRTVMNERVEKLDAVTRVTTHTVPVQGIHQFLILLVIGLYAILPLLTSPIFSDLVEDLHFIVCSLKVMLGALLDLDGHITIVLKILG